MTGGCDNPLWTEVVTSHPLPASSDSSSLSDRSFQLLQGCFLYIRDIP